MKINSEIINAAPSVKCRFHVQFIMIFNTCAKLFLLHSWHFLSLIHIHIYILLLSNVKKKRHWDIAIFREFKMVSSVSLFTWLKGGCGVLLLGCCCCNGTAACCCCCCWSLRRLALVTEPPTPPLVAPLGTPPPCVKYKLYPTMPVLFLLSTSSVYQNTLCVRISQIHLSLCTFIKVSIENRGNLCP